MDRTFVRMTVLASLASFLVAGCDSKPGVPVTASGRQPESITVNSASERDAATTLESARVNYRYRLEVLQSYYNHVGNAARYQWTVQEIQNLDEAQQFRWRGVAEVVAPTGESIENTDEQLLVEYLVQARNTYLQAVDELAAFYERQGLTFQAAVVRNMQARCHKHRRYDYLDTVPPADLRPTQVISEADAMYEKAFALYQSGRGPLRSFVTTDYDKQREALDMFKDLIRLYPNSTKIALSAYWIAEINKEYFNIDLLACKWYERAWTWDPNIPKPARFQAATVWDYRLKNRSRAVECYKLAVKYEQFNQSNVSWALGRIEKLENGR